jgi:nucleoside-diphosphate-sugar epimerase
MRILVTGGSGFIGTNLIEELSERKYEVVNLDICAPRLKAHVPFWRDVSLLDEYGTSQLLKEVRPDYVIHAAARTDLDGRSSDEYAVNTTGTLNLINAMEAAGSVRRAIFISSMLVCRNGYSPSEDLDYCPDTTYGESKVEMERIIRERMGLAVTEFVIVRPTSVWGPWFSGPYLQFFLMIRRGLYVHPGHIQVKKQFAYVGNVVAQMLKLITANSDDCAGSVFYVGDYSEYIVREWADSVQRELGARRIRSVPLPMLKVIAAIGDVLNSFGWRRVPLTSFRLTNMLTNNSLPYEKSVRVFGPLDYSVTDGVRRTIAWLDKQTL